MDDSKKNPNESHHNELVKIVRILAHSFELLKQEVEESQKRYNALFHEAKKDHEKVSKIARMDAYIIAIISIVGIGLTIIVASYWSYKEEVIAKSQQVISRLYKQADQIQVVINKQFQARNHLINAMTKLRSSRAMIQSKCKNGKYIGANFEKLYQKVYSMDFNLASASYQTTGIFNDHIKNKILHFESLVGVDKHKNICAKSAPRDKELRLLESEINNNILDSIYRLKKKRGALLEQADDRSGRS